MNQSGIRAAIIHWNPACWGQCFQNDLDFAGASIWWRAHQKHFKCGGETWKGSRWRWRWRFLTFKWTSQIFCCEFSLLEAHWGTALAQRHWLASWLAVVHRSLSCCMCQNQSGSGNKTKNYKSALRNFVCFSFNVFHRTACGFFFDLTLFTSHLFICKQS